MSHDVVENQGKLFDFVAHSYPNGDTEDFIKTYMASKTRKSIDEAKSIGMSMKDPDRLDKAKWKGQNLLGYALMMVRKRL